MTYYVSSGTLNSTNSTQPIRLLVAVLGINVCSVNQCMHKSCQVVILIKHYQNILYLLQCVLFDIGRWVVQYCHINL